MSETKSLTDLIAAIDKLTKSHDDLKSSIDNMKEMNESTRDQVKVNTDNISTIQVTLEKQSRENNLIIFNLQDIPEFNKDIFSTLNKLFDAVFLQIPDAVILDAYRLGRVPGNRPLLVKFNSARWVREAFTKLDEFKKHKLSISNDRSPAERERRKKLLYLRRYYIDAGRDARLNRDRLIVDGKVIDPETEAAILNDISSNKFSSNSLPAPVQPADPPQQPALQTKITFAEVTSQTPRTKAIQKRGQKKRKLSPDEKQSRIDVFATPRGMSTSSNFATPSTTDMQPSTIDTSKNVHTP